MRVPSLFLAAAVAVAGCGGAYVESGPVEGEVMVEAQPPAPQVEVRPAAPYGGAVWIEGFWFWNGAQYVWTPGRWEAPRRGWVWMPHHYVRHGRHWRYVPGHWRRG